LYLVLFGPLMERIVESTPGFPPGDAWQILVPGLLIQLGLFGSMFAGFGLLGDLKNGVLERMRVTPVKRSGLLIGRAMLDAGLLLVQAVLLMGIAALTFGMRAPIGGIVLSLVIVALLAITLASCSYAVALILKSDEVFPAVVTSVSLPLMLLSGILIPITTGLAPSWLYWISRFNPFTHVMEAERGAFRGDFSLDTLFTGAVVLLVMTVLAVWWGARVFARENA
ncbi:MAG: ABC transporter permease, partial [Thermocrispum sp.]